MLKIDIHTHSIASGHSLNTVYELISVAKKKGLTHIGITDHGPSMEGAPHEGYFWVSDQITNLQGIEVFLGIEANILNEEGDIDLGEELLKKQRIVSAGLHEKTPYSNLKNPDNTESIVNAMKNPFVKIITHPYRPEFPVNIEEVVKASYNTKTLLEINNNLFSDKKNISELIEQYSLLIKLCKSYDMPIIVGSDAHVAHQIGNDDNIMLLKNEMGLIDNMIINNNLESIHNYLEI